MDKTTINLDNIIKQSDELDQAVIDAMNRAYDDMQTNLQHIELTDAELAALAHHVAQGKSAGSSVQPRDVRWWQKR